ncbi:hypothetical protein EYC84_011340 [Monilinia fructicola]|uniref:Uncharacterized protein n=1 Tax=Monilinia fructicola TaxID=38448 RepID=A0A5M9J9R6_MONFR|nr:hypothetical protein EYC84_011340 [Monilinia fructicola]
MHGVVKILILALKFIPWYIFNHDIPSKNRYIHYGILSPSILLLPFHNSILRSQLRYLVVSLGCSISSKFSPRRNGLFEPV